MDSCWGREPPTGPTKKKHDIIPLAVVVASWDTVTLGDSRRWSTWEAEASDELHHSTRLSLKTSRAAWSPLAICCCKSVFVCIPTRKKQKKSFDNFETLPARSSPQYIVYIYLWSGIQGELPRGWTHKVASSGDLTRTRMFQCCLFYYGLKHFCWQHMAAVSNWYREVRLSHVLLI